jgi:histidinol-phosphatase (PHP family)
MMFRTDYHIHTTFSDGRAKPEEYVEAAIRLGLNEIGFSEHLTLSAEPQRWSMNPARLSEYISYISSLKKRYPGIAIRTGIELDFFPGKNKELSEICNAYPFDYIIGSVHYMGEQTVDLGPEFYIGKDINVIFENYFNLICEAISSGLFDIIGHVDLVRIHRFSPSNDISNLYEMVADSLARHNVTFELNTNGRNKPLGDFYPDRKYLHIFANHGAHVCVNSDAHYPVRVGQFFDEAYELLRINGFSEMSAFINHSCYQIPF